MKVMVAYYMALSSNALSSALENVEELLNENGFQAQLLQLPPMNCSNPLTSVTSWRLVPLSGMADCLLCLDACSAILQHPKKYLWLLAAEEGLPAARGERQYLENVLAAGVRECRAVFASKAVVENVDQGRWGELIQVDPPVPQRGGARRSRNSKSYSQLLAALRA